MIEFSRATSRYYKGSLLSKEATHYLVPMVDVAKHYFDILEFKELSGIVFLQTVVNAVQVPHLAV